MAAGREEQHNKTRVLIVEGYPIVCEGIASLISRTSDFEVCGKVRSVAEALKEVRESRPDVVTLDLRLPEGTGFDLIQGIHQIDARIKVLVISVGEERLYAERCIRSGASGFVGKDKALDVLLDALRQVVAGKVYVSAAMGEYLLQQMAGTRPGSLNEPAIHRLSDRELQVFERLGEGLTTREIAEELNLSVKTIESHRESIKEKLGIESSNELMRFAVQWELET